MNTAVFQNSFPSSLDIFKGGVKQESKLICPETKCTLVQDFIQKDMVKFCQSRHHHILLCLLRAQLNLRNLYKVIFFYSCLDYTLFLGLNRVPSLTTVHAINSYPELGE